MLSYRLVLYCDICIVSLKFFFTYGTLNLTFLHYITLRCDGDGHGSRGGSGNSSVWSL